MLPRVCKDPLSCFCQIELKETSKPYLDQFFETRDPVTDSFRVRNGSTCFALIRQGSISEVQNIFLSPRDELHFLT